MIIKALLLGAVVVLAVSYLAAPVAQAGRATAKFFKDVWENKDENTDI